MQLLCNLDAKKKKTKCKTNSVWFGSPAGSRPTKVSNQTVKKSVHITEFSVYIRSPMSLVFKPGSALMEGTFQQVTRECLIYMPSHAQLNPNTYYTRPIAPRETHRPVAISLSSV